MTKMTNEQRNLILSASVNMNAISKEIESGITFISQQLVELATAMQAALDEIEELTKRTPSTKPKPPKGGSGESRDDMSSGITEILEAAKGHDPVELIRWGLANSAVTKDGVRVNLCDAYGILWHIESGGIMPIATELKQRIESSYTDKANAEAAIAKMNPNTGEAGKGE